MFLQILLLEFLQLVVNLWRDHFERLLLSLVGHNRADNSTNNATPDFADACFPKAWDRCANQRTGFRATQCACRRNYACGRAARKGAC